jgi:signal transduction histidine kinase
MVVHDITHLKQLEALQMRVLTETANKIQIPLMQAISTLAEINQTAEVRGGQSLDVVFRLSRLLNRIREWMDELLIVARIEAGIGIQPTMVNVPELIQEWARGFNDKAVQEKTTRVNVALGKELPPVYADRDLMRRMLEQAIGQAVDKSKARPDEAVRLTVDCHQGQVWLGIVDAASSVATSAAPRRLATGTLDARLKSERAGQDLIMVRAIVNRMGGQVWARGQDTLAICLPAARSNGK